MAYFAVYIPPSKAGFEGTLAHCAGSIAAINVTLLSESAADSGAGELNASNFEDPEYPPDSPLWLIFTEKSKALEVLRHYKEARLREFPNRDQAESYVQFGFESIESLKRYGKAKPASKPVSLPRSLGSGYKSSASGSTDNSPFSSSPTIIETPGSSSLTAANIILAMSNSSGNNTDGSTYIASSCSNSSSNISLNAERPPFRAPSKQELVEFRKQIEAGNFERVGRTVWENPRFLISSGDTPTSLKEGYRYNAMHICAQCNQARVAELILKTVSDRNFTQLYACKKSRGEMCTALNENLLDYYLNMPDKGRGETPLHFSVKYGHVAVVKVLTSYPQCKSLMNSDGMQPKDIICQRAQHASPEVFKKLELLLSEPYYVPVLRATGNELPPQIGQPFMTIEPPILNQKCDESGKLNMELKISALAGPMPREQAVSFCRRWKTPPRIGGNGGVPLTSSPYISPIRTPNKSLLNKSATGRRLLFSPNGNQQKPEQNGDEQQQQQQQHIEHNNNCTYKDSSSRSHRMLELPATPFRNINADLFLNYRSNISLSFVDSDMDESLVFDSYRERHIKNSDIEKGLEIIGRQLAHQENLEWREYWDFLDDLVDISSSDGIARFEAYLCAKSEQTQASLMAEKSDQTWNFSQLHHYLDLVADRGKAANNSAASVGGIAITQVMTPYTCVEKSLQVFAKRITKTLINNIGNMVSINDTLLSELKRLKSLIVSFKDDARFITVDFGKVHSRIAHLVASYIAHSQEVSNAVRYQLMQMLRKLLQLYGDRREHLKCVCGSMLPILQQVPFVRLPDELKTEELCSVAWEMEQSCSCAWDANLSRKTSRRKRAESLRAQIQDSSNAVTTSAAAATTTTTVAAAAAPPPTAPPPTAPPAAAVAETIHAAETINAAPGTSNDPVHELIDQIRDCVISDSDNHNNNNNSDDDGNDDSSEYFDCADYFNVDESSEDEAIFMTPPESRSPRPSCSEVEPHYDLFIFGKEPTKRDLDVLNAIFNVDIDKEVLPFVHAWRTAMESFSTEEMDLFPSPTTVQKSHKSSFFSIGSRTPGLAKTNISCSSMVSDSGSLTHTYKKLLATPKLNELAPRRQFGAPLTPPKMMWTARLTSSPNGPVQETPSPMSATMSPAAVPMASDHQAGTVSTVFQTPFNKARGLFSKYRETRYEPSPSILSPEYVNGQPNLSVSDENE